MGVVANWQAKRLERVSGECLEFFAIGAARLQADAISKRDDIFSVQSGLEFPYPSDIDDDGAVDAQKEFRIQRFFQCVERNVKQMCRFAGVQLHVVLSGFNPRSEEHTSELQSP